MTWLPPSDGYQKDEEGPEAKMHREQQALEALVERLIASLRPEDARRRLISWANIKKWKLPRRVRPIEPS
jgi:hypothetical protein